MTNEIISCMIHIMEKELEDRIFTSSWDKFKGLVRGGMIITL